MMRTNYDTNVVYVVGLDYQIKATITPHEAMGHILAGKMSPFEVHPTKRARSAGGTVDMAWPLIVRLNYWKEVPPPRKVDLNSRASRADILKRDGYTCGYCGDRIKMGTKAPLLDAYGNEVLDEKGHVVMKNLNPTVDHILPQSRGGGWTWANMTACCVTCNQLKADRTPEEAGMKLLWTPRAVGVAYPAMQKHVWDILEAGGGFVEEASAYEGKLK